MRNLVGSELPIMVIDDSSGDEMSLGTRSQTSEDGEDIDAAMDAAGESQEHNESASLRMFAEAWHTGAEENALSEMLGRYN